MLYLAIPTNILLWECETWAIKKTDWEKIEAFQTKCVCKICGISMWDVKDLHITNDLLLKQFNIDPVRNITHSRQLKWLGKIPRMSMKRLTRKMLGSCLNSSRPVGRPTVCPPKKNLHFKKSPFSWHFRTGSKENVIT